MKGPGNCTAVLLKGSLGVSRGCVQKHTVRELVEHAVMLVDSEKQIEFMRFSLISPCRNCPWNLIKTTTTTKTAEFAQDHIVLKKIKNKKLGGSQNVRLNSTICTCAGNG